jgi:hypothetical protein
VALFGLFAALLGVAAIFGALRRRRGRAAYPETYAAAGGVVYTGVQVGCGVVLILGGASLIGLALATTR